MIKGHVDTRFYEDIKEILELGTWDKNPRAHYSDGVPAHTKFITDKFEKYAPNVAPITELRRIAWKTGIRELMWIYQDQTSELKPLRDRKVYYWDDWKLEGTDSIGSTYGEVVSRYDIINNLLKDLETNPFGRRHVINLWQEESFKKPHGLKPCAFLSMFTVQEDPTGEHEYMLNASLTLRSSDFLTAGHINRIQYKALQLMLAKHLSMSVGTFSVFTSNMHIYDRHLEQAQELLRTYETRLVSGEYDNKAYSELVLNVPDGTNFYDIKDTDFELVNYKPVKHVPKLTFDLGI